MANCQKLINVMQMESMRNHMIQRNIDTNNLTTFDFFKDFLDTARWLDTVNRKTDANKLREADRKRFYAQHKNLKANG